MAASPQECIVAAARTTIEDTGDESRVTLCDGRPAGGYRRPPIHAHFDSVTGIASVVIAQCWTLHDATVLTAVDPFVGLSEAIGAWAHSYVRFGRAHAGTYRVLFGRDNPRPVSDVGSQAQDSLTRLTAGRGQLLGATTDSTSVKDAAVGLWIELHGIVVLPPAHPRFPGRTMTTWLTCPAAQRHLPRDINRQSTRVGPMSDRSATGALPTVARGRPWVVLVAMAGSASMILLDQAVVAVALSTMTREQDLSVTGQQWVVNAYGLAVASLVAFGGWLADRFGAVPVFRLGVIIFTLASLACSAAPSTAIGETWIIAARAAQGVGAALMIPVSAALVVNSVVLAVRGRAMALYAGISQIFLVAGPVIGGYLTEHVSWRAVFWINAPIAVAILVLLRIARPTFRRSLEAPARSGPVLLLVGGLALSVLALQQAGRWGPTAPATVTLLVAGASMIIVFIRTQLRSARPLLHLGLLTQKAFLGNVVVFGMFQFALLAIVVFGSLYLQDILRLNPTRTGLTVLAFVLPIMAAAPVSGWWYDRRGVRGPVLCGLALTVLGVSVWAAAIGQRGYLTQLPGMILSGFGLGLAASPCYTDALGRIAPAQRGRASGVIQTVRQIGGILGVITVGSVVLAVTHGGIRTAPAELAAHAVARGFAVAAAVFAVAWGVGVVILPKSRVTDRTPRTGLPEQAGQSG